MANQQTVHPAMATQGSEHAAGSRPSVRAHRAQLVILGSLRATEAIAWTSIFPYVYLMIESFDGIEKTMIPYYASLLIAVFTFGEFVTSFAWARLSDYIGRKPTLLIGCVCSIISALVFGTSHSMLQAIFARAFGGLSNPNGSLVQTCVVELADNKEQRTKALAMVSFLRSTGTLLGPVLGGVLADPYTLYPNIFTSPSILRTHRFLLPNLMVVSLQLMTFIAALLFLEETSPNLARDLLLRIKANQLLRACLRITWIGSGYRPVENGGSTCYSGGAARGSEDNFELEYVNKDTADETKDTMCDATQQAFTAQVIWQILSVSLLAFHKVASDTIMPLFLAAPVDRSVHRTLTRSQKALGFGYSSSKIGIILLSQAIFSLFIQATLVPAFINRMGALRAYRIVLGAYPFAYILTPVLPTFSAPIPLILVTIDLWIKVALSSTGYICSAILISETAPSSGYLSRINGAATSSACLARSIGPLTVGRLFALGSEIGQNGIAFWAMAGLALIGGLETWLLEDHH
ncbi:major facilitator superfamily domain-containing protein [Xylariaceae sp. FL1019]|nr:major facilitator superfamily domain-containing protein [Xylariaceae sp. FL1019]